MFKRILIPIDGSPYSNTALAYGIFFAKKYKSKLTLLHVIDFKIIAGTMLADIGGMTGATPYLNLRKDILKVLKEKSKFIIDYASKTCKNEHISYTSKTVEGIITKEILRLSSLHDCTIMGQHGENSEHASGLLGTKTEHIVRNIKKPLLIVPKDFKPVKNMLFAYDGSQSAKNALKNVSELVKELKLSLSILTCSEDKPHGESIINEASEYFCDYNISPKIFVRSGNPAEIILQTAQTSKSGIIVMGFHGHSAIRDLILGSTTEEVMRNTTTPVLLIH